MSFLQFKSRSLLCPDGEVTEAVLLAHRRELVVSSGLELKMWRVESELFSLNGGVLLPLKERVVALLVDPAHDAVVAVQQSQLVVVRGRALRRRSTPRRHPLPYDGAGKGSGAGRGTAFAAASLPGSSALGLDNDGTYGTDGGGGGGGGGGGSGSSSSDDMTEIATSATSGTICAAFHAARHEVVLADAAGRLHVCALRAIGGGGHGVGEAGGGGFRCPMRVTVRAAPRREGAPPQADGDEGDPGDGGGGGSGGGGGTAVDRVAVVTCLCIDEVDDRVIGTMGRGVRIWDLATMEVIMHLPRYGVCVCV